LKFLFLCAHNVFRSKVAEALFKKMAPEHEARSAGTKNTVPADESEDWYKSIVESASQFGLSFEAKSTKLSQELLDWADRVIVVADDAGEVPGAEVWRISDVKGHSINERIEVIRQIKEKVRELVESISAPA